MQILFCILRVNFFQKNIILKSEYICHFYQWDNLYTKRMYKATEVWFKKYFKSWFHEKKYLNSTGIWTYNILIGVFLPLPFNISLHLSKVQTITLPLTAGGPFGSQ